MLGAATLGAGLVLGAGGAFLSGRAGDLQKKELSALGDYPGLDTGKITADALKDLEKYLPQGIALSEKATQANQSLLNKIAEENIPGFAERKQTQADLIDQFLRGEVPDDVAQAVERRAAATGLGLGISGSGLGRNLVARDLGLSSLNLIGQGFGMIPQFQSSIPLANPVDPLAFAGPTPMQLAAIRGHERDQRIQIGLARAGVQGQTGAWGNYLNQLGGLATGAGTKMLTGGMGGGFGGTDSLGLGANLGGPNTGSTMIQGRYNIPGTSYGNW